MNAWNTAVEYTKGQSVFVYSIEYECVVDHKSNIFANDFFEKKLWKRK